MPTRCYHRSADKIKTSEENPMTDRRQFIQQAGLLASAAAIGSLTPSIARA